LRALFLLIALFVLLFGSKNSYAITEAGTSIVNTAFANYEDDKGFKYTITSNTLIVKVAPVYGIEITPDRQERLAIPGETVNFPFYLKNTGNARDSFLLEYSNLTGDSGDFEELSLYIDANNNGIVDVGEPLYNNGNPPVLAPGEVLPLVLQASLPASVSSGVFSAVLNGRSSSDGSKTDLNNIATARVETGGFVSLKKSADRRELRPGEKVLFRIDFSNPAMRPVAPADISVDFNNDGVPEVRKGILIEDPLPEPLLFSRFVISVPQGIWVFKGEGDSFWKDSLEEVRGEVRAVGLILQTLAPDQRGYLKFYAQARLGTLPQTFVNFAKATFGTTQGPKTVTSNFVFLKVKKVVRVVIDDTDDGNSYAGSGSPSDPDDLMVIDETASGQWVEFKNEVWNLGNTDDVINVSFEKELSQNIPKGAVVSFYSLKGVPLVDTNGDGIADVGRVPPGGRVEFITRFYIPAGQFENILIALKATSSIDPSVYDLTFDKVFKAEAATVQVLSRMQAISPQGVKILNEPLKKKKIVVYEYGRKSSLVRKKVFWTDSQGFVIYDEKGNIFPIYNWMRRGYLYRLTTVEEINGFTYYLTAPFKKVYFDSVNRPGEEKCWDFLGNQVPCDSPQVKVKVRVKDDGTKLLINSLDPSGYVYDGVTGEKINGACVYFYRCTDKTCSNYYLVSQTRLDLYPDGATLQENPQVSGPTDRLGNTVGKGEGAFQFLISNFKSTDEGWYFITVNFDCNFPASDPTLAKKYYPVGLKADAVWSPYSGKPYLGEKFYVDTDFPGAILLRVPLLPADFKKLEVRKSVSPSSAFLGDFVKWTITVKNPNSDYTVYDVRVFDVLPRGFRYKGGTTTVDGERFKDPEVRDGRYLSWDIGSLEPGKEKKITFYTVITPGVKEGKLKNVAFARGWSSAAHEIEIPSNEAFAYIKVSKGVFTDRAYIIGRVFIDQNRNGVCDEREPGVKGAKVYLEDGRFAVTDDEGKYHFDDVRPGTHVVKLDLTTIPDNVYLRTTGNRNAKDPGTYFADVYPGDIFKVNFALVPKKIRARFKGELSQLSGRLSVERVISAVLVDPSSGKVAVKNSLSLKNLSETPLYELTYREQSPYRPRKGSTYLNDSPFEDPIEERGGFYWKIPILLPEEELALSWISEVPSQGGKAEAELSFSLKPYEGSGSDLFVSVPVIFEIIKPKTYRLTVHFASGQYRLSGAAKKSLERVAEFLRKSDYETIFIKVVGSVDGQNKERGDYKELSLKRARAVKEYLKTLLIDLKRVKVEK